MAAALNPRTAYAADWQYTDGVEDATLIDRGSNAVPIASYPVKVLRAGRMSSGAAFLWPLDDCPPPKYRDALTLDAPDADGDAVELVIVEVKESPTGPYKITTTEPPQNE